jgi:AraC-like DNA-binding protein
VITTNWVQLIASLITLNNRLLLFNLVDIFSVIVIFQLLFTSVFLFLRDKGKVISNVLLGAFFLSISLNLADRFLIIKNSYLPGPGFVMWGTCLPFLFGPLLYLYSESVLYKNFSMSRKKWVHFLPFIFLFLACEPSYLFKDRQAEQSILDYIVSRKLPTFLYWAFALLFIQFILYVFLIFQLLKNYRKEAADNFSNQLSINISWLRNTIIFFGACMILTTLNAFMGLTPLKKYYYLILSLLIIGLFVFINQVLFKALRMPELFASKEEDPIGGEESKQTSKYAGSALPISEKKRIHNELLHYMDTHKPYFEPELTIEELAKKLSIKPKTLSQVINESLQQNFFDFINRYRIEEAKRLLKDPKDNKITVSEILYEVGFNSRSSFYALFKKYTGLTPNDYKKKDQ